MAEEEEAHMEQAAHVEQDAPEEEDELSSKDDGEEEGAPQGEANRHSSSRLTTC
jgi:hypothetical protein